MKAPESKSSAANVQAKKEGGKPFFPKDGQEDTYGPEKFFGGGTGFGSESFGAFSAPVVQAKLTIGAPDDPYEREADAVADKVVQKMADDNSSPPNLQTKSLTKYENSGNIQRKCATCEQEEQLQMMEDKKEEPQEKLQRKPIFESGGEDEDPASKNDSGGSLQRKCDECQNEETENLHRKESISGETTASADITGRLNSSKGSGAPLPGNVATSMEGAFGTDFSNVRIHTNSNAVQLNRDLNAQAFTHGSDVYFGSGKFSPGTKEGDRLLAHELTHVKQQGGGVRKKIQRYMAGVKGHQTIERKGLLAAGFSKNEIQQVYLGNWLRDFSQMPPAIFQLVNLLALGEFGEEITMQELGAYVPSEHFDNPEGGGTIEDKRLAPDAKSKAKKDLSEDQQTALRKENAAAKSIRSRSLKDKLPEYIERGKMHAKQKLKEAIQIGDNAKGRRELGNALHAIEDYYSHSNFVEAAIWTLKNEKKAPQVLLDKANKIKIKVNKSGKPIMETGTYVEGANKKLSIYEQIVAEAETGQLEKALVTGLLKKYKITADMVGQEIANWYGSPILLAAGLMGGEISAANTGLKDAYHGVKKWGNIGGAIGSNSSGMIGKYFGSISSGFVGGGVEGIREAASRFTTGAKIGGRKWSSIGREMGGAYGPLGNILGTLIGGILGPGIEGMGEAGSGFGHGLEAGNKKWGAIGGEFGEEALKPTGRLLGTVAGGFSGGIIEGLKGTKKGFKQGKEKGEKVGEQIIRSFGKTLGIGIKGAGVILLTPAAVSLVLQLYPKIAMLKSIILALARSELSKWFEEQQIHQSHEDSKKAKVSGLTHSELAKDGPDHPLFEISSNLASEAVRQIGVAMKAAWQSPGDQDKEQKVIDLVDKFISTPDHDRWWEHIVNKKGA
jgi:DNA-directed RNA polymerase subunit M/transcription elongation factor TFIIS